MYASTRTPRTTLGNRTASKHRGLRVAREGEVERRFPRFWRQTPSSP
jgi:hypothetical protein